MIFFLRNFFINTLKTVFHWSSTASWVFSFLGISIAFTFNFLNQLSNFLYLWFFIFFLFLLQLQPRLYQSGDKIILHLHSFCFFLYHSHSFSVVVAKLCLEVSSRKSFSEATSRSIFIVGFKLGIGMGPSVFATKFTLHRLRI